MKWKCHHLLSLHHSSAVSLLYFIVTSVCYNALVLDVSFAAVLKNNEFLGSDLKVISAWIDKDF